MCGDVEKWTACPEFEGLYEVSCRGRVRRVAHDHRTRIGLILRRSKSRGGPIVKLHGKARPRTVLVHRLVARAFLGNVQGRCVLFVNGNREDCRTENLLLSTRRAGTARGSRNGMAKLDESRAAHALRLLRDGRTVSSVARRFGVSRRAIRFLRDGLHWAHLRT